MIKSQLNEIWSETLKVIQNKINRPSFDTWFNQTELVAYYDENFIIKTPNNIVKDWLNNNYIEVINESFQEILKRKVITKFVVSNDLELLPIENNQTDNIRKESIEEKIAKSNINPRYNFDNFVVGNSNKFTHAACMSVAESLFLRYNPLFIYGGVGLGKTHLMQAIGNYVMMNSNKKVLYVSSEKFTNELINGIRDDRTEAFRNKYRNIDFLLIDDIQFLAKKERTQEEFFHTFNALYEANKQIIISSDRPPKEIPTLEDRLRTRFEWGLITDIQSPDYETRVAILRKKAKMENFDIPDEIMSYIAEKIDSNIRELEGALIRVIAYSSLSGKNIDLELAKKALKEIITDKKPVIITPDIIQEVVSENFNIRVEDLKSKKRNKDIVYPRQISMYLCRTLTDLSLPKIGEYFGGRDHTTVIHSYEKISSEIIKNPSLSNTINSLTEKIKKV